MPGNKIEIDVIGIEDLRKALLEFDDKVSRKAIRSATLAGAKVSAAAIAANAPVMSKPNKYTRKLDPRRVPGAIKRNVTTVRRTRGVAIASLYAVGVENGHVGPTSVFGTVVGSKGRARKATRREKRNEDPFYTKFVERGYTAVGSKRGGSGRKIPGRFFMENAHAASDSTAFEAMRKKLAANIQRLRLKK